MKIFPGRLGRWMLMAGAVAMAALIGFLTTAQAQTSVGQPAGPLGTGVPPAGSRRGGPSSTAVDPSNINPLTGRPYATTAPASDSQPFQLAADLNPTAQGHLAAAQKALDRAQAALTKALADNHTGFVEKAQADVNKATADITEAIAYVTAHPEASHLSSTGGAGDPPNVQLAVIPASDEAPDLNIKAAIDALNVALNEFLNSRRASARGPNPMVGGIGGYRDKIMADIGQASTDVLAALDPPAADQPSATSPDKPAAAGTKTGPLPTSILDAVVIISGDDGMGTGFVAKLHGQFFIVTNQHVLSGQTPSKLTIKVIDGTKYPVTGELYGARDYDVAILKIPNAVHFLEVMDNTQEGANAEDIVTVPGNSGGAGVVTQVTGKVLGIGPELVEVDAKFIPGNSGSPIIDRSSNNKVIGLATYTLTYTLDELKKTTDKRTVRWFGYRLDNITTWDKLDLARFGDEGKKIEAMESLTAGLIALLTDKATSNRVVLDAMKDYQIRLNTAQNRGDKLTAIKTLADQLQYLSDSDIHALATATLYPFHARRLAEEKEVRAEISKAFSDTQQILDSIH